jgi:hypothetical protein
MLSTKKLIASLIPVGLVSAVVAVAMTVVPAVASATEITPANTGFSGALAPLSNGQTLSVFVPTNGFNEDAIACKKSAITGTTPMALAGSLLNQNKPGVGTDSLGYGSVITNIEVSFSECGVYEWKGTTKEWVVIPGIEAKVATTKKSEGKGWTLAASQDKLQEEAKRPPYTAAGVPPSGATITIPALSTTIVVSPNVASSVFDEWTNGTSTTASKDRIDGQITDEATPALGESPWQFEAVYSITVSGGGGVIIKA